MLQLESMAAHSMQHHSEVKRRSRPFRGYELQAGDVILNNYGQVKSQARDQHIVGDLTTN